MTTPPKTFEAHGFTWMKHNPDDPIPVNIDAIIHVLIDEGDKKTRPSNSQPASYWWWTLTKIIGWRYAEPQPEKPDELATLREENRQMREAIKEAHEHLCDVGSGRGCLLGFNLDDAMPDIEAATAKLYPFITQ